MIASADILKKYIEFFEERGHKRIANSPLVLLNDPTTLFTSSGMQPLVPYLLGETHPDGTKLVNVQNCIRTQDIEEVGDNRHTTFFRMLGNWGLGVYFKKEEIPWFWEFLTKELGLPKEKLYITVFEGIGSIPKDTEAVNIWTDILEKEGLIPHERIFFYSDKSNWWSRSGTPDKMPAGEPGGPSTEVFYDFGVDKKFHENSEWKNKKCHPNCDCGRYMEIGNSVFMQYMKQADGSFKPLPKNNIDFGGGLERLAAAVNDDPDVFTTDLYSEVITAIEQITKKSYREHKAAMRVIADHTKAAVFLIADAVIPSNKEHGYILRRLMRRAAVKMYQLNNNTLSTDMFHPIISAIIATEGAIEKRLSQDADTSILFSTYDDEINRFGKTLEKGLKEVEKHLDHIDNKAFDLYQSYGFPFELLEELVKEKGKQVNKELFQQELQKHKDLSKTASAGKFRGGLADHSEKTIMGHTATHLLHQALRDTLGNHVHQTGSNITAERVRFDFNYDEKLTDEQIKQVENSINEKIKEDLPVHFELISTEDAKKMGAIGLFMDTYGEKSKIYFIGPKTEGMKPYSIEFCGGPHVAHTGMLQSIKILKQENLGKNQKRLYLTVGS